MQRSNTQCSNVPCSNTFLFVPMRKRRGVSQGEAEKIAGKEARSQPSAARVGNGAWPERRGNVRAPLAIWAYVLNVMVVCATYVA
eukprot:gene10960-biopygen6232